MYLVPRPDLEFYHITVVACEQAPGESDKRRDNFRSPKYFIRPPGACLPGVFLTYSVAEQDSVLLFSGPRGDASLSRRESESREHLQIRPQP